jgi:hypothetical protein
MKGIWGEPDRKYFWEASLTGDLICGHCGKTLVVDRPYGPGLLKCSPCGKGVWLETEVIALADQRARRVYPSGRPKEDGSKWKGEDPYGG